MRISPILNTPARQPAKAANLLFSGVQEQKFIKSQLQKHLSPDDEQGDLLELGKIEEMATSGDRKLIAQHMKDARKSERPLTQWINNQVAKLGIEKRTGQKPSMTDKKFADNNPHHFTDEDFVSAEQLAEPGTDAFKTNAKEILDIDLRGSIHEFLVEKGHSKV